MEAPACHCTEPGWCERHRREKTPHLFKLCQTRADYRKLWDELAAGSAVLEQEASSDPSIAARARLLSAAMARWLAAGRPVRTADLIREIFETKCQPCPQFAPSGDGAGNCRLCGCALRREGGLLNKIKMATEGCPNSPPRWESELAPTDALE